MIRQVMVRVFTILFLVIAAAILTGLAARVLLWARDGWRVLLGW